MFRKALATLGVVAALTFIPAPAYALHCQNASRPTNTTSAQEVFIPEFGFSILVKGNWVLFPGAESWIFIPPGSLNIVDPVSDLQVTPAGRTGNFQDGGALALLENSVCNPDSPAFDNRQTTNGIQWCHTEG